ncbi:MAG TPA: hypothetical protein PKA95_13800 [Thermomicrobiales bacterium]|nr:hypothetical protein [Thermomicrobiales bacterium]
MVVAVLEATALIAFYAVLESTDRLNDVATVGVFIAIGAFAGLLIGSRYALIAVPAVAHLVYLGIQLWRHERGEYFDTEPSALAVLVTPWLWALFGLAAGIGVLLARPIRFR